MNIKRKIKIKLIQKSLMSVGKIIKENRKKLGLNQKQLAAKIDVTGQAVWLWENDKSHPEKTQIDKLCKFFNITEAELFGAQIIDTALPVQKIPIVSWVHANKFQEITDPFPVGASEEFVYTTAKGKNIFALKIESNCMQPEFNPGDIVVVKPNVDINNGDFVVVADRHDDKATFKQYKRYGNKIILRPLNPECKEIELDDDERYVIVGKVVEKIKKY